MTEKICPFLSKLALREKCIGDKCALWVDFTDVETNGPFESLNHLVGCALSFVRLG